MQLNANSSSHKESLLGAATYRKLYVQNCPSEAANDLLQFLIVSWFIGRLVT